MTPQVSNRSISHVELRQKLAHPRTEGGQLGEQLRSVCINLVALAVHLALPVIHSASIHACLICHGKQSKLLWQPTQVAMEACPTTHPVIVHSLYLYRLLKSVFSMYDTEKDGSLTEREVGNTIAAC